NHPLVNFVLAVVAEIVGDARARHSRTEAVGLRHAPHSHVATVAPAGQSQALRVDRCNANHFIDAGQDVAPVAVAEILYIGLREWLALSITSSRIGQQQKISVRRQRHLVPESLWPMRLDG